MRAVELPIDREFVLVDDGSSDGTQQVLEPARRQHRQDRQARREPRQGRGDPHRARARDRRPRADPGRRPRVRPRGLAQAARRRCSAARRRWSTARGSPASAATCCSCTGWGTGSCRSPRTCSTTRRSATWRPVTSSSTAGSLEGITIRSDRFDFEPEITAKVLRQGVRIYEVPISYTGPRVRRGQEDHLARRLRGAVRAREVPLRALMVRGRWTGPRWAAVVVNYEAGHCSPTASTRCGPTTRPGRSRSWSSTTARPTARSPTLRRPAPRRARDGPARQPRVRAAPPTSGSPRPVRRWCSCCNADTVLAPGSARPRCSTRSRPTRDVAVVGPHIVNPDGTTYPSARTAPGTGVAVGHALLGRVAPAQPVHACVPPDRRRRRRAARRRLGVGRRALVPAVARSTASAAGTSATSCSSRTSTSVARSPRRATACGTSRRARRRPTWSARAGRRAPVRSVVDHHRAAYRYLDKWWTGPRRLALPAAAGFLGARARSVAMAA